MSEHLHPSRVKGCHRCELSADEVSEPVAERVDFTDIVLSIDVHHGIDDPMVMRALDPAISRIERWLGCDVLISSHHSNDDGETFRTVSDERDGLRAALAARPAVDVEGIARAIHRPFCQATGVCLGPVPGDYTRATAVVAYLAGEG